MDWNAHLRETAAHLAWMASLPGELALEHAKHREQELARSPMYAELPRFIREVRQSASPSPSAPELASTTAVTGRPRPAR
jgi:hypothetical protein